MSSSRPNQPDPDRKPDPDSSLEETVDYVNLDATIDLNRPDAPEATVDLDATVDPDATGDPDATVDPSATLDPNVTVETDLAVDPDATVEIVANNDPSSAKTVLQETVEVPSDATSSKAKSAAKSIEETIDTFASISITRDDLNKHDCENLDATLDSEDDNTTAILDSTNLGQTINPKSLSKEEAEYWHGISAEFTSHGQPTSLPPAIDRTIVETRLQIRNQSIATQLSGDQDKADYRLVRLLGRGGMGNVFVARQGSLDRLIAVKVIRPLDAEKKAKLAAEGKLEKVEQSRRQQFLTEAVVTGDLDHPNIVPIHDVAITGEATLFYSMKRVVGTPWSDVIADKTRDENIEILIKVADAIGFAHTRGVVHRDIKPDNVMLGDFGVVMVMDWGIALAKPEFEKLDSITPATGLGGTPSMMAPEMAIGPIERIGPAADIYLLGATLFQIITGNPPHHAGNVSMCLRAVATNSIREYDPKHRGELMNIALKAMATQPEDRYPNTTAFQDAIREYRSHSESIALATRAEAELETAVEQHDYSVFARSQFGFEEAIALWPGNERAKEGLHRNRIAHAEAAYRNGDFELGLTMLTSEEPAHAELIVKLNEALRLRRQREARFAFLKKAAAAMLAVIFIGGSAASYAINEARNLAAQNALEAQREAKLAADNAKLARDNEKLAIANEKTAIANEKLAVKNATAAKKNADEAERNRLLAVASEKAARQSAQDARESALEARESARKAQYESYVSQIGLAKARIDRNEFSEARRLLKNLVHNPPDSLSAVGTIHSQRPAWEIRYLSAIANQATAAVTTQASVAEIAMPENPLDATSNHRSGFVRFDDGTIAPLNLDQLTNAVSLGDVISPDQGRIATAIDVSQDGSFTIIGLDNGDLLLRRAGANPQAMRMTGHRNRITRVQILDKYYALSSSTDRTVRIWDLANGASIETLWHIAPVVDVHAQSLSSSSSKDAAWIVATVVSERRSGQVVVWRSDPANKTPSQRLGFYAPHTTAVTCVNVSTDGQLIASGDADGHVLVWPIDEIQQRDLKELVTQAVESVSAKPPSSELTTRLIQRSGEPSPYALTRSMSTRTEANQDPLPAHASAVRRVTFIPGGTGDLRRHHLVSCGEDYLVASWLSEASSSALMPTTWRLRRLFRGHGGPVGDAVFIGRDQILSGSDDQSIRLWNLASTNTIPISKVSTKPAPATASVGDGTFSARVHQEPIWASALSSDGTKYVTASRDRTATLLAIEPGTYRFRTVASLKDDERMPTRILEEGSSFRAMSMQTSADGKQLFVGGADSVIRIWNIERGTELKRLHETGLNQILAVASDGKTLITGADQADVDALVWNWDIDSARASVLHRLRGHEETVAAVAVSADGRIGATGDRAGRLIFWDLTSGQPLGRPNDTFLGTRINDLTITSNGQHLWVAADDGRLTCLELHSGRVLDRLEHHGVVSRMAISDDGRLALTVSELQKVTETIHRVTMWQVSVSNDLIGDDEPSRSKTLLEFSAKSDARTLDGGRPGIAAVGFRSTSSQAVIAFTPPGDAGSRVQVWSIDKDFAQTTREIEFGLPVSLGDVSGLVVHRTTIDEIISLHGSSAYRWNITSGELQVSYRAHGALTSVAFSSDASLVATGSRSLKLWDADSGASLAKLESPHAGIVRAIAFVPTIDSAKGDILLTGGDDARIRRWRFDRSKARFISEGQIETINGFGNPLSLAVSPDHRFLLATTDRGQVVLHRLDEPSSSPRILLNNPDIGEILAGCFSANGQHVAVGGEDRLIRIWNLNEESEPAVCQGHAEAIEAIAICGSTEQEPDRILSAGRDGSVRVWDPSDPTVPKQGRELLQLIGHDDGVTGLNFHPDRNWMITSGRDGRVVLWPTPPISRAID